MTQWRTPLLLHMRGTGSAQNYYGLSSNVKTENTSYGVVAKS